MLVEGNNAKLEDSVAGHSIFSVQTEGSKTRPSTTVDTSLTKQTYIATSSSQIGNLNGKTLTNKTVYVKGNQAFSGTITEVDPLSATGTFWPTATLGAPHTICTGLPSPRFTVVM